jgi:hypothetical protein
MTLPVVDLSAGAERLAAAQLVLPDRPDVAWFAVLVPVPLDEMADPHVTARQVAVDAALTAREVAEQTVYAAVLAHRERERGAA